MHNRSFLLDTVDVISEFHFIIDLNGDLKGVIMLVISAADTSEWINSEHLGILVDNVILLKLLDTLLLIYLTSSDIWTNNFLIMLNYSVIVDGALWNNSFRSRASHDYLRFQIN